MAFESRDEARSMHSQLIDNWSAQIRTFGGASDAARAALAKLSEHDLAAIADFADPEVAGCAQCAEVSVFGGPSHNASSACRSGGHPHCTCDACF
jgi:CobQ-like glutamine amidotransferase family enzyme